MTNSFTSFRHDRERNLKKKKILISLLILSMVIFVVRGPVGGFLSEGMQFVFMPLWKTGAFISDIVHDLSAYMRSKSSLQEENDRLNSVLDSVYAESHSRELLRDENAALKLAMGRHEENTLLLARVLAGPGRSPYDTMVIDVGTKHGISPGMKVYGDGDFVIGEVTRVFGWSSIVTLYSSSGTELPVIIGTGTAPTIAYGQGGGNFRIVLPKGLSVHKGDIVEIPALAPEYAGVVDAVVSPEGSSLEEVYFSWPFNIYRERWVYIGTQNEPTTVERLQGR